MLCVQDIGPADCLDLIVTGFLKDQLKYYTIRADDS